MFLKCNEFEGKFLCLTGIFKWVRPKVVKAEFIDLLVHNRYFGRRSNRARGRLVYKVTVHCL